MAQAQVLTFVREAKIGEVCLGPGAAEGRDEGRARGADGIAR